MGKNKQFFCLFERTLILIWIVFLWFFGGWRGNKRVWNNFLTSRRTKNWNETPKTWLIKKLEIFLKDGTTIPIEIEKNLISKTLQIPIKITLKKGQLIDNFNQFRTILLHKKNSHIIGLFSTLLWQFLL
jgi:hypothetical protein